MPRIAKPYIKCVKRKGNYEITVMKGGALGHTLGARSIIPIRDDSSLHDEIVKLVTDVRAGEQKVGM